MSDVEFTSAIAPLTAVAVSELEPIEIETLDTYELTLDPVEVPMMITLDAIDISSMDIQQ